MRSGVAVVSACAVKSIYWLNEASTSSEERPCHVCTGTGLTPATSAPGPGSRLPHHACHICTGTGLTPATSAPGPGSRLPHLHACIGRYGALVTPGPRSVAVARRIQSRNGQRNCIQEKWRVVLDRVHDEPAEPDHLAGGDLSSRAGTHSLRPRRFGFVATFAAPLGHVVYRPVAGAVAFRLSIAPTSRRLGEGTGAASAVAGCGGPIVP